jgi:hypothetical protein
VDGIDNLLQSNLELEASLEAARKAVQEHLYGGLAVGPEGGPFTGRADAVVDQAWFDRYEQLKAAADETLSAANQAWSMWVARTRHL